MFFIAHFDYFFSAPRSPLMPHSMHELQHPLANVPAGIAAGQPAPATPGGQVAAQTAAAPGAGAGTVSVGSPGNDKYQIMVDVSHFTPEEISVKMVDNTVVVTGKHEDKADNYGYVSRQFSRKYLLPQDVEPETVTSTLSADGILSISVSIRHDFNFLIFLIIIKTNKAPRKPLMIKDTEPGRAVPIAMSNQIISPGVSLAAPQFPVAATTSATPAPVVPTSIPVEGIPQQSAGPEASTTAQAPQ